MKRKNKATKKVPKCFLVTWTEEHCVSGIVEADNSEKAIKKAEQGECNRIGCDGVFHPTATDGHSYICQGELIRDGFKIIHQ